MSIGSAEIHFSISCFCIATGAGTFAGRTKVYSIELAEIQVFTFAEWVDSNFTMYLLSKSSFVKLFMV